MLRPRTTMTYAKWLEHIQREKEARAAEAAAIHAPAHMLASAALAEGAGQGNVSFVTAEASEEELEAVRDPEPCEPGETKSAAKADPAFLPAVEYFRAGHSFRIGAIDVNPFTIPHDAADPCGFVFHAPSESIRMAIVTDLGYIPPNVKMALREVDV